MTAGKVEVVLPSGMPSHAAQPLLDSKRSWIERTLERLRAAEAARPRPRLEDGGEVPYLGGRLRLRVSVEPGRVRAHVAPGHPRPDGVAASDPAHLDGELRVAVGEPGPEAVRAALEGWYRRRARIEVARRLDAAVARAGASYARLQIRGQRTRWASCSSKGAMSFNWRLLLAPAEILDYVVEHEVAHLEVHDHSPRFWALLASRCPDYRERERWLRANGQALRL